MRAGWDRMDEPIRLSLAELSTLVQPAFPGQSVVASELTRGGLANTNIRLELSAYPRPVLLRLYTRQPELAYDVSRSSAREAALHRLLSPRLPVPGLLFAAADNAVSGHPYMLREWVDGERLEVVAHRLDPAALAAVAHDVGAVLAGIHAVTFSASGYLDDTLAVVPFPPGVPGSSLAEFLDTLLGSHGRERLGPELLHALMEFAERTNGYAATWSAPPCLVHADFGGSNILVNGEHVAAVVDWEFAFVDGPFIDFGNLLRPPLGDLPGFEAGVAAGYRAGGGVLPDDWRRRSLHADLTAWAAFLGRPQIPAALATDARRMIARTITQW